MSPSLERFEAANYYPDLSHLKITMNHDTRRTHSKAIAIKRNIRAYTAIDEQRSSAEQMYDMATWRMYHRIIDYRQRHPIKYNSFADDNSIRSTTSTKYNDKLAKFGVNFKERRADMMAEGSSNPFSDSAMEHEDYEIFEIDL